MTQISEGLWALDSADTLVVPSVQRALALKLRIASEAVRDGRKAWRTPQVLGWSTWLERQVRRASAIDLLPEFEEWLVFRECARRAFGSEDEPAAALIESLRRSAALVFDWMLPERTLVGTPEAEWLARTIRECDEACAERRAVPRYRLGALAVSTAAAAAAGAHGRAHLSGFIGYTPVARALLEARACLEGPRLAMARERPSIRRGVAAEERAAELSIAATWARAQLEDDPAARLLILIPDLRRREQEVLRAFGQTLSPSSWLSATASGATLLGLEGGRGLGEFPLVQVRLALLRRPRGIVAARALLRWLRSICADPAGDAVLAHLDRWLRASLDADTSEENLERLLERAPEALRPDAQALRARLELLRGTRWASSEPLKFWTDSFRALWRAAGASAPAAGSAEQQVSLRLDALLDELAGSVAPSRRFDGHGAAALLAAAVARTRFEPASGDASVTLSANLGNPVVPYDGIWVCGLDAATWPAPPRLDSFIPAALQRAVGLAFTSAAQLAHDAQGAMQSWADSTPQLILSRPCFEDGVERQESQIAARFLGPPGFLPEKAGRSLAAGLHRPNRMARFDDACGVAAAPGSDIARGARALQLQAQCAFNAYAQLRLLAAPSEERRPGIDPRERGRLLHSALEFLWKELGSGAGLRAARDDLRTRIERAIGAAEVALGWQESGHVAQRHRMRERRRLAALLLASCEADAKRPAFLEVRCESAHELEFAGSRLRLRIDRMDRLPNGHVAIFDYKSGQASAPKLFGERLVDPQLPIYALAAMQAGETVDAVALAFLTRGAAKFRGVGADQSAIKVKVSPDWDAQLARWKTQLDALARALLAGDALRDPSEGACRYCHLQVFCRVSAVAEEPEVFEEEADDGAD